MPVAERRITPADIIAPDEFGRQRAERRAQLLPAKKRRRLDVGPHCTFYFENYDTMLFQIQEMLFIERGGDEQLVDEMSAYNPLIPQGDELVATMMFEIDDPKRRLNLLLRLGGIENHVFLQVGDEKIYAVPEDDAERTSEDGKTSSVHFFHFPFTAEQKKEFTNPATQVMIGSDHPEYAHMSVLSPANREELAKDFA